MELTNPQRVAKLAGHILRHPRDLPRYFAHNLLTRHSPVELELPWFSYGAIDFLEKFLRKDMHVFEFGSGGSTLFFARRCKSVTSVEEDGRWLALVSKRVAEQNLGNVRLQYIPFDFHSAIDFETSDYLKAVRQTRAEVIVVDGTDWTYRIRPVCFRVAEEQIAPGGIIIVDDSWRYAQLHQTNHARRVEVFESTGPARFGVTSTDVYFY